MTTPPRVCTYESRLGDEMSRLVQRAGGIPFNAPSMQEIPLSDNSAVFEFAEKLLAGQVPLIVFMTGVGTQALFDALETRGQATAVQAALAQQTVIARGPKPASALAKMKIRVDVKVPEPNTWQELTHQMERLPIELQGKQVAVQEYGIASTDFYRWLNDHGATVLPVPVYRWGLPDDLEPLKQAVQRTVQREFEIQLWTSAQQATHVLEIADQLGLRKEWLAAANRCVIGSIGPTASERLCSVGLIPDLEPSHPKMAHLVRETLQKAADLFPAKQVSRQD